MKGYHTILRYLPTVDFKEAGTDIQMFALVLWKRVQSKHVCS